MPERSYYTYIVASRTHVLYIGVTGNIERRMAEHKSSVTGSFAAAYHATAWCGSSGIPRPTPPLRARRN